MSIYERIRKGSYRGAEFDIINVGRTRVKKNTEHQYANSVRRYIEERGVQNQDFTVTLSVFGSNEDYFEKRDALRTALEAEGEGVLVLPIEGEFNVKCTEFSDSQNILETLGRCDFTCTFKVVSENEKAGNPVAIKNGKISLANNVKSLRSRIASVVNNNVVISNALSYSSSLTKYTGFVRRMAGLADPGTFRRIKTDIQFMNPLDYPDYEEKITGLKNKTGLDEGVLSGVCEIEGYKTVVAVMASEFLMGSMGMAVGEIITKTFEVAEKMELPVIIFTASGGARMQEGILSLMQMAKTSAAVQKFSASGGLYVSVLTHPTTGGVSASFATLADITIAEPGALIGFAGPRVIEQTIGQKLPAGFQRAEYLEEHGFVDGIVSRLEMRDKLAQILKLHEKRRKAWLR